MKKIFALLSIALLCIGTSSAQEAFKHLGASLEVGTTGLGVNLSYPVITNRLVVTVGYNFPSFGISSGFDLNSSAISNQMSQAIGKIDNYNKFLDNNPQVAQYYQLSKIPTNNLQKSIGEVKTNIDATVNFGTFKAFVEYYPTDKSYFHFTAGFLINNGSWLDINGSADKSVWAAYTDVVKAHDQLQKVITDHPELKGEISTLPSVREAAKIRVNNETFAVDPETGHLDTKLTVKKFKPYIGVGFGSSVPTKKRLGFQLEIGAFYQSKPTFESDAKVDYDSKAYSNSTVDEIVDYLQYLRWYPQISFRFTGRIF